MKQPGAGRQLGVDSVLADLRVVLIQSRVLRIRVQKQKWLPAGALEKAETEIEGLETVAVAGGEIQVSLTGAAFVLDRLVINHEREDAGGRSGLERFARGARAGR